jgi:hypothetical protein
LGEKAKERTGDKKKEKMKKKPLSVKQTANQFEIRGVDKNRNFCHSEMMEHFETWQDAALAIVRVLDLMRRLYKDMPNKWAEYCARAKMPQSIAEELLTCYDPVTDKLTDVNKFFKISHIGMIEGEFHDHKN